MAHMKIIEDTIKNQKGITQVLDAMYLRTPFILIVGSPFDRNSAEDMGKLKNNLYITKPYENGPLAIGNGYYQAELEFYLRMMAYNYKNTTGKTIKSPATIGYHLFSYPDKLERSVAGVQKVLHRDTPNEVYVNRTMYQGIHTVPEYLRAVGESSGKIPYGVIHNVIFIDRSVYFRS